LITVDTFAVVTEGSARSKSSIWQATGRPSCGEGRVAAS